MTTIRRILVATDLSPRAERAVERAARLCVAHGAELELLHVFNSKPLQRLLGHADAVDSAERELRREAQTGLHEQAESLRHRHGITVGAQLIDGRPARTIAERAASADLLVIGSHGEHFVRDLLLGGTAQKLVRLSPVPVLITRLPPEQAYRQLLVALDFSPYSAQAVQQALRLASEATLYLLHVVDVPFESQMRVHGAEESTIAHYRKLARDRARQAMNELLRDQPTGRDLRPLFGDGHPAEAILSEAEEQDAELIVLGTAGHSELARWVLGSVTLNVLQDSTRDVLVVPVGEAGR